jgi:BirA family biotin operon repressor/biotin-[acetyl-CoA-carboxylase] ligase
MTTPDSTRTVADIPIYYWRETTSTQDEASVFIDETKPDSRAGELVAVLMCDHQTSGKGRRERVWNDRPGTSFLGTFIFGLDQTRPISSPMKLMVTASSFLRENGADVAIKWPNDIMSHEFPTRKLAGCLSEIYDDFIFVGLGMNITADAYETEHQERAISLDELGYATTSDALAESIIDNIGHHDDLLSEYRKLSLTIGGAVRIEQIDGTIEGIAQDVSPDGALIVELENGEVVEILEGDVVHARAKA